MAENEVNTAINHARYIEAVNAGKTMKRWESIIDEVTRKDHIEIMEVYSDWTGFPRW